MASKEVSVEIFPYIRLYKDGTFDRISGTDVAPAGLDPATGVISKDVIVLPETGVSARIYRPSAALSGGRKLPLVLYFHGGAFIISSPADPFYHGSINALVAAAGAMIICVDYRRCPENPLPAAYDDSWAAYQWVVAQAKGGSSVHPPDPWLQDFADFDRFFLVGDSGGANMSHHLAIRVNELDPENRIPIRGIGMIHPYFWGEKPIGCEVTDPARKALVDSWWKFVCPSDKGCDDPLINPFADGSAAALKSLDCEKVLVFVAGTDILRDRGKLYYESLVKSGWRGTAELVEIEGVDHVFHIIDPASEKAKSLIGRLASFISGPMKELK